jgi:hypothetical protein
MWHCLVDYWVCYCMFHSMGMKVFPRVAWSDKMAGNVIDWCQSMIGFYGVSYPGLRLAEGIFTIWYQSFSSTLSLDGPEG